MFTGALNVSDAWNVSVGQLYVQRLYDLDIRLEQLVQADSLLTKLRAVPGVKWVEAGSYTSAAVPDQRPYAIKHTYPDKGHGGFVVQALPIPTRLLAPNITAGRWLNRRGANEVVLNRQARRAVTQLGDSLTLQIDGKPTVWRVVGFSQDIGAPATAYVSTDAYGQQTGTTGQSTQLRLAFTDREKEFSVTTTRVVDALLAELGRSADRVAVQSSVPTWVLVEAIGGHMRILVNCLLSMALLMALVGLLGLLSTMSLNVLERTREIGIMRAIGATPATIRTLIVWEGLLMGLLSIVPAFALSLGLSYGLGKFIGNMAFRLPLPLTISVAGLGIWLTIVVVGSLLATALPTRRADQLTTREALAYE